MTSHPGAEIIKIRVNINLGQFSATKQQTRNGHVGLMAGKQVKRVVWTDFLEFGFHYPHPFLGNF